MVVEEEVLPYLQWLLRGAGERFVDGEGALVLFAIIVATLFVLALVGGFVVSLIRHGPIRAGEIVYNTLVGGAADLVRLSPRRIGALAGLAIKESIRRRVFVALAVFGLILMFASWYLQTNNTEPARLYLSFVLTATSYLLLLLSLLLAAFSLPNDFKSRTIFTVVTKPVRAIDVVLGRMLGFTAIGTVLLAVMAIGSWVFVTGSLSHTHAIDLDSLRSLRGAEGESIGQEGETSLSVFHRHVFTVDSEGVGLADPTHGHTHAIESPGGAMEAGPAEGYVRARVPKYGELRFLDRKGVEVARGISVGNEWAYRSFITGSSQAAAIWKFSGVDESNLVEYADGGGRYLPIELLVRVYRSYIGKIERGVQGSIQLRNPETGVKSSLRIFMAKDNELDTFDFANEQVDTEQNEITITGDLVSGDGEIEVIVQCLDRSQYYGFAQADCFLRLPEGSPVWNFAKGFLSIWMQMVIVIAVAVAASTVLNGPISMVFTVSFLMLGLFREFFVKVATGESYGGGPVESLVRMVTQMNVMTPMDPSPAVDFMKGVDWVLKQGMQALAYVLPDFGVYLQRVDYVAEGFSIPSDAMLRDVTVCLAYVVGLAVVGYFCLRTREVAK